MATFWSLNISILKSATVEAARQSGNVQSFFLLFILIKNFEVAFVNWRAVKMNNYGDFFFYIIRIS